MRVLIAVDGSKYSNNAIDFIANRAWMPDDEFLILTVLETLPVDIGFGHLPNATSTYTNEMYRSCKKTIKDATYRLSQKLPNNRIESRVVISLVAVDQICDSVETWGADLLVLGTHDRRGLNRLLFGSVAEEVLKKVSCSVEIVKSNVKMKTAQSRELSQVN